MEKHRHLEMKKNHFIKIKAMSVIIKQANIDNYKLKKKASYLRRWLYLIEVLTDENDLPCNQRSYCQYLIRHPDTLK